MVKRGYTIGNRVDARRIKRDVVVVSVILIVFGIASFLLFIEIRTESTQVNSEENMPIITKDTSANEKFDIFEKPSYTLKLPEGWAETDPDTYAFVRQNVEVDHYQTTGALLEGRYLNIYVDELPDDEPVTKVLPVNVQADQIIPIDNLSPQCHFFTSFKKNDFGVFAKSKWEGIEFECNTNRFSNIIAALDSSINTGIKLENNKGSHRFLIIFGDNSPEPDNSVFLDILRDFELK